MSHIKLGSLVTLIQKQTERHFTLHLKGNAGFSWKSCNSATDPLTVISLTVEPDPIVLSKENLTLSLIVNSTKQLSPPIPMALTIERKTGFFGLSFKIPCVNNLGSCTTADVCEMCLQYQKQNQNLSCECPFKVGLHTFPKTTILLGKDIPNSFTGDYKIKADFTSKEGHAGCVQLEIKIVK
ncbi:unnamed protein product [Didymodactylos carnosus]|uniref:MD-2-related lipid-recognition domain-containing protein n=1 Tax=Didymodactylos carnosus TaxID=1234261 RepID=A0A8S2JE27_9BILA|nr:unnamed protein product [Didymodactylos carnosus]CAF3803438.1 unnamed protein product [Didymodactylos carnosus]